MKLSIHPSADAANAAAADLWAEWLVAPSTRNVMLAAGNTPLEFYRRIGERRLPLGHLNIFALDEYVGVPLEEPRNCANLIRLTVVEPWGVPAGQFFPVSSLESDAPASVQQHEQRISAAGGIDALVLGLGQNAHLGFNEPGSAADSTGRVLDLDGISIEANRRWFNGAYAPSRGVTVGMKTILAARRILVMAYGIHKTAAVKAMVEGPCTENCPASLLQKHANVRLFLDEAAAAGLRQEFLAGANQ
jgi:glucosamine-6-phosphate deaminase